MALSNTRLAILVALIALVGFLVDVRLEQHANHVDKRHQIEACHSIVNEVTRTSCINGWEGP